jgi:uncharacterized protein
MHHHITTFLQSTYAATSLLIGKAFGGGAFVFASKLHKVVSNESLVAVAVGQVEVIRAMNHSGTLSLTKRHPNLLTKYCGEYLAKSFSQKTRREILIFHHRFMMEHVTESFYEQILESGSVLWNEIIDENRYMISLSFNVWEHREGDLSLIFYQNNNPLYEISFTVTPGYLINTAADKVLFVGRVQGVKLQADAIKNATKACHDIAPPYLLMEAAQGIARVLAIDTIGGVSDEEQLSKSEDVAAVFFFAYDAFWETYSVNERGANIYGISVPFRQKPLEEIAVHHRRRTRRKRQFKKNIADVVSDAFAKKFLKT